MLVKEKFYRLLLIKKLNIFFITFFLYFLAIGQSQANFQKELINKLEIIDSISFKFTQKIGDKIEFGSCYIKYPLLMNCEYPKKKKNIIINGKKFAIVKKRYKKIYYYPLKKTPLFYLLKKEIIIDLIKKTEPSKIDSNVIEYSLFINDNLNNLKIYFNKNTLEFSGWKTIDAYSNEVIFLIKNIKTNIVIEEKIFKIPREEDL